jgi:hypothetical protein
MRPGLLRVGLPPKCRAVTGLAICGERPVQPPRRAKRPAVGWNWKFDARTHPSLQQCDELITFYLTIAEDRRQETRANGLARVDRNNRSATVGVTKEVWLPLILATSNPAFFKAATISRPVIRGRRLTPR